MSSRYSDRYSSSRSGRSSERRRSHEDGSRREGRHRRRRSRSRSPRSRRNGGYESHRPSSSSRPQSRRSSRSTATFEDFQRALDSHKPSSSRSTEVNRDSNSSSSSKGVGSLVPAVELEKIAKRKVEQESVNLKPTFLTRKQRQKLALERRQKEFEAQQKNLNAPSVKEMAHPRQAPHRGRSREVSPSRSHPTFGMDEAARSQQLELIKGAYLGQKKEKKKPLKQKAGPKFKFAFDWDATEDTTAQELNPLYRASAGSSLMFGRGFHAGYDRREQRKQNKFYDDLVAARGSGHLDHLRDAEKAIAREDRRREQESAARLRNRHWSEKRVDEMEERDWRIFREDFSIATRGSSIPNPLRFWKEGNFPASIHETLEKVGFKEPTPIQRAAIPIGLQNRDVVGIAETGSGKTCAFLIPLLTFVSNQPPLTESNASEGPYALIMAPTRELAQQIQDDCDKFATPMGYKAVSIVGGLSIEDQSFALREGAEVIIATPGRLFDCIERRYLVLNQCSYVVLDEADRMIDMNFEPQIVQIMDRMPSGGVRPESGGPSAEAGKFRQTIMFSATMPPKVELLAKKYLQDPVFISVGDRTGAASKSVEQSVIWTPGEAAKKKRLMEILGRADPPVMIFLNSKKGCDTLSRFLDKSGFRSGVIHGGKAQEQRMESLDSFKKGRYDILVATDVAGRGIDVSGVKLVVNYDMPSDIERYTHRIGRTGRAGQTGSAISFLSDSDSGIMYDLHQMLTETGNVIPPELRNHEAVQNPPGTFDKKKRASGPKFVKI